MRCAAKSPSSPLSFFFTDPPTTEIYTLSLHDALPISGTPLGEHYRGTMSPEESMVQTVLLNDGRFRLVDDDLRYVDYAGDRKSTRLNSSHSQISYAVFCLKKKNKTTLVLYTSRR